jgi:hypothetical protein
MSFDGMAPPPPQRDAAEEAKEKEDRLKKLFRSIDSDGSGAIDATELGDAMRLMGVKATANSAKKVLKVIDTDGSGEIELCEFMEFFKMVDDPDALRDMLSSTNQAFLDYKNRVLSDPNFGKLFYLPPTHDPKCTFDYMVAEAIERVEWMEGNIFLTASLDGKLRWFDATLDEKGKVKEKKPVRTVTVSDQGLYGMSLTADKKFAAIAAGQPEQNVWWWDLSPEGDSGPKMMHTGHMKELYCIAVSGNKQWIASGGKIGHFCLHQIGKEVAVYEDDKHEKVVTGVAFSPNSEKFATTSYDGNMRVYNVAQGNNCTLSKVLEDVAATGWALGCTWFSANEIVQCGDDFTAKCWNITWKEDDGSKANFFGHTNDVTCVALSPAWTSADKSVTYPYGQWLLTGAADGSCRVFLCDEKSYIEKLHRDHKLVLNQLDKDQDAEMEGDCDAEKLEYYALRIKTLTDNFNFLDECKKERDGLKCLQARGCLVGHKLGLKHVAWRYIDENTAEVLTASQDQSAKLFRFEIPNPKAVLKWKMLTPEDPQSPKSGKSSKSGPASPKSSKKAAGSKESVFDGPVVPLDQRVECIPDLSIEEVTKAERAAASISATKLKSSK